MLRTLKELGPVRRLRLERARRTFLRSDYVNHFGRFASFAEATAALPPSVRIGWDHASLAEPFFDLGTSINPRDYPVLFWLRDLWAPGIRVFDFGGHLGMKRYAFERYLRFDADQTWIVCDLPVVLESARRIARERQARHMSFTSRFDDAADADVLLCLGVLQYLDNSFSTELRALKRLPDHIIINGLPLHDALSFVTLVNNAGRSISPYRISARTDFVAALKATGYTLVDHWFNAEKACRVPLYPECDVPQYSGFYFRRRPSGTADAEPLERT